MLFTGKGDGGTTKTLATPERISKNEAIIHCLGTVDELNAWTGYCRSQARNEKVLVAEHIPEILFRVQENLFTIQGKLAGAELEFGAEKIIELETIINSLETKMPPIKSFLIPGETAIGAIFDIARTITRRAERTLIAAREHNAIDQNIIGYFNRLSSLFYAFARFSSQGQGIAENAPSYS